jgi:hypothetical protein
VSPQNDFSIKELSCVKLPENPIDLGKANILRKEQALNLLDTEKAKDILESACRAYSLNNAEACKESLDSIRTFIESHTLTEQDFSVRFCFNYRTISLWVASI